MKQILFLIMVLFLSRQSYAQDEYKYLDSIILYIQPDSIKKGDGTQYIFYTIRNRSSLSFVSIEDVVISGLKEGIFTWPRPFLNSANFLSVKTKDFPSDYGDGQVVIIYNHLPRFFVIEPYKTKVLKILLDPYLDILNISNWRVGGNMHFAVKYLLDFKIQYDFPSDLENYKNSLDYSDTITVTAKTIEQLRDENKIESSSMQVYEKLNDLFIFISTPGK